MLLGSIESVFGQSSCLRHAAERRAFGTRDTFLRGPNTKVAICIQLAVPSATVRLFFRRLCVHQNCEGGNQTTVSEAPHNIPPSFGADWSEKSSSADFRL